MADTNYEDLKDLLLNNERAKNFYKKLPNDIQHEISHHGEGIQTMAKLRQFASETQCKTK